MIFFFFSLEKIIIPCSKRAHVVPPKLLNTHKINLHLPNFLAAAVSKPALYRLLPYHISYFMQIFRCLIHTKISIQVQGNSSPFPKKKSFSTVICQHIAQNTSRWANPRLLSATAYSIYSKLSSRLEAVLPSAPTGGNMPWRQGLTYRSV